MEKVLLHQPGVNLGFIAAAQTLKDIRIHVRVNM